MIGSYQTLVELLKNQQEEIGKNKTNHKGYKKQKYYISTGGEISNGHDGGEEMRLAETQQGNKFWKISIASCYT